MGVKKLWCGAAVLLSTVLMACGSAGNRTSGTGIPNTSGPNGVQESQDLQALSFKPNQDWLEGLRTIASTYHAFGGYGVDRKNQEIVIYTANSYHGRPVNDNTDERGRKLGLIRQAFTHLMASSSNMPLITRNGEEVEVKGWKVRFQQTDASLDDLLFWKDALFLNADSNKANMLSFDMDSNKVIMQVPNESLRSTALENLSRLGIPDAKVTLRVGEIRATKTNDASQYRPVVGGVRVTMPNPQPGFVSNCTLGLPVLLDGTVEGYLTAGHCVLSATSNNGERMSQDGYAVATKFLDPAFLSCTTTNCGSISRSRYADAVFYKSDIGYTRARIIRTPLTQGTHTTLQNADGSDQYWDVTSTPGLPALSEALINIGATNGYRSAAVTNQYADINIEYTSNGQTVKVWILRTVEVYNDGPGLASCGGDSGSPWFQQIPGTTNQVRFFGIQSAASISPAQTCGQYAYFSPVTQIENHFGAGRINYKR